MKVGSMKVVRVNCSVVVTPRSEYGKKRKVKKGVIGLVFRQAGQDWVMFEDGGDSYVWDVGVEQYVDILFENIGSDAGEDDFYKISSFTM